MLSEDKILPTYEQYLKEEGIQPTTREGYNSSITSLINASVNLFNPSSVKVGVSTDLNFKTPASKGNLTFERTKYETSIEEEIKRLESKD
jgi:hypothetical protein